MAMATRRCMTSETGQNILLKIEAICLEIIHSISQNESPFMSYPRRSKWKDLVFEETISLDKTKENLPIARVQFDKPISVKKFATMLKILKIVYTLVQENRYCTKRDIFYQYPDLYPCQSSIDQIIDDIACMLVVPRWELHILATSKGLVSGDLQFEDSEGTHVDCQHAMAGIQIAAHSKDMQSTSPVEVLHYCCFSNTYHIQTRAHFVLVVEKDATFQKLLSSQFCQKMRHCILITGKGYPDNATRLLLQDIFTTHRLPIFILVDSDPHGIEIMAVYKYGSKSQAFDNKSLAVPSMEWIGILPEDIERLHIPSSALIPMSSRDLQKCKSLKCRPYFLNDISILSQLDVLIELGKKAEIQCLDSISSNYLCDIYLPSRLGLLLSSVYNLDGFKS